MVSGFQGGLKNQDGPWINGCLTTVYFGKSNFLSLSRAETCALTSHGHAGWATLLSNWGLLLHLQVGLACGWMKQKLPSLPGNAGARAETISFCLGVQCYWKDRSKKTLPISLAQMDEKGRRAGRPPLQRE